MDMSRLGTARRHWWLERMTSVALVPLSIWLICALGGSDLSDWTSFTQWLGQADTAIWLGLFFLVSFYHSKLGLEVIVDDYVSAPAWNQTVHRIVQLVLLVSLVAAFAGLLHFLT